MGRVILANITWNSKNWKEYCKDDSNHRYVANGGAANESWNFDNSATYNNERNIYGFVQFNHFPKIQKDNNLIVFYSQNKIVGFYGGAGVLRDSETLHINRIIPEVDEQQFQLNIFGNNELSFVLNNKIDNVKENGFLEDKKRIGQIGFNYLNEYENVINILKIALELNPEQKNEIERLKIWYSSEFKPKINISTNEGIDFETKNLILYGPPGTGKTYITKSIAVRIINKMSSESVSKLTKEEIDNAYSELITNKKIFFTTFHQSYAYEQFIEGISVESNVDGNAIYKIKDGIFKIAVEKSINSETPVVLIIDEINRGNISKIFGELITLIEQDKRWGMDDELSAILPYSEDNFYVPSNLYIIGTMNTADRSLVQLDTALRRRFEFEEMMPKYRDDLNKDGEIVWVEYKDDKKIDLSLFLEKLNANICKQYDRDHQIGHSFLMKVEKITQLQRAWENKIMPLLQEYFYSDYEKLSSVIGKNSDYLKKDGEDWILNMRVNNFDSQFKLVYDSVCGKADTSKNADDAPEK